MSDTSRGWSAVFVVAIVTVWSWLAVFGLYAFVVDAWGWLT